jgi:RNA polymerase sigma-70 factor (ECF subfamily)
VNFQNEYSSELVSRIEAGDSAAETELVEQYATGVRLMLLKKTGCPQLSNDLCQETMLVILRKLRAGDLNDPNKLPAYIQQTAAFICIDHYRKEKRYVTGAGGIISLQLAHYDKKGKSVDRQQVAYLLEELLDQLSVERDREMLRRFYLCDEDKVRICADLDLTPAHFDRVLYRARKRMRELLRDREALRALLFGSLFDD